VSALFFNYLFYFLKRNLYIENDNFGWNLFWTGFKSGKPHGSKKQPTEQDAPNKVNEKTENKNSKAIF
jgi:hypothetical protein